MPRVVNLALAAFLLLLLVPLARGLDGKPVYVQVALLLVGLPCGLLVGLCLVSAVRPGALGRAARRARSRRR